MKITNTIFYVLTLACLGSVIYLLSRKDSNKTAFFLSAEVYNEFDYKKELENDLIATQDEAQRVIDSLELDLEMTLEHLKSVEPSEVQLASFERKQQNYFEFRNQIESGYSTKSQEFYNQIWERINTYVKDYGQENGYTYIFGANGDGTIMYAEDGKNITEEIIEMINQKYAGE